MLSANKEKLQSFLMGSNQFVIPFFQRSYVWKVDNWNELWENITDEYKEIQNNNNNSEHFIGTVIIKQKESQRVGALEYDLIDGQQRLTTVCLLLRAFYDTTDDANLKNWIKTLLVFTDSYGQENIRILHSKVDREYFQKIILDTENNVDTLEEYAPLKLEDLEKRLEIENKIKGGYLYFRKRIEQDADKTQIRSYITIILEKLPVIHMALSKEDDVQQIFDTINSLGVKLTTAELLKNLLYSNQAVIELYNDYWYSVFEADEDAIDFWNRDRTSGRVRRTTVELFLYSYLVILKETGVKMESLFKEFKEHLKDKTDQELIEFAKELKSFAEVYQQMPDGENLSEISFAEHEKRFFHIVREFEITTIFPLILYIFKKVTDHNEQKSILNVLESYLTRRTVCKLTTKNYNNLFMSLLGLVKKMDGITADKIRKELLKYTEVTNRFPDDTEFEKAFYTAALINKYSREVLYCIALYQLSNNYTDNSKLNLEGFSVEHIMPKKWRNRWNHLPNENDKVLRDYVLLTLGNLTLVKGKLNSSMRDANWTIKKETLRKYSTLRQTTDYINIGDWNEGEIASRSKHLYQSAIQIWKR
ncbi:DUF262 domain-containing HNH endonuclease family protein [uncultured Chryseobacterium sp.]|uniref:DUF262 domain-containing protein n=1 Tax=uncultured Chryseobacterium sp. TaxID=259322 RepID=UPI0025EFD683|nr:DUF262 domain-containing HNH endonuclease family protein [uncultured Chryseobacterium sp.]